MMEKENCEMLFEYLKSILYDSQVKELNIEELDEPYQKLGKGLSYLQHAVEEMLAYSADLSRGNLSGVYPARENMLCTNLKNLHANLNHLTWQAKQVAAGDYSQHVSYLGEFSEAFNTMTDQLRERETLLKEEAQKVKKRAEVIESYNELLVEMTRKRNEWILVVDEQSREIVYCNKSRDEKTIITGGSKACGREPEMNPKFCEKCTERLRFLNDILNWQDSEQYKVWEMGDEEQGVFRITTFQIEWRGCNAYAHIVADITEEKAAAERLTSKAYYDTGTGIRNRLYFEEYMEMLQQGNINVTLCYLDLDGLKFVNDRYGHTEGDNYIRSFVSLIQKAFRNTDVFARIGGDEFCIILPNSHRESVKKKLDGLLHEFISENDKDYPRSFSYGLVEIKDWSLVQTIEEIIKLADAEMYKCKRINKRKYHEKLDTHKL
ncbi:MAG: diguanylate cyclase [Faecalicatena sp.]|uniref:sensor domain-containing diguanylate cyclase n=1 Tax=Faecalicatena sp. TaxID=2005360 RepID=UPI00258411F4|nr:diguanylate cyclase [Faecalicatena sp.]MCI6465629.1 diguanylate cyclase [Faecalicatena sp.]MDY5618098.1 diguanylate cyclase [Lachnospiraceae bacterium]